MNAQTEYYLEFLITEAFKGKGFQKISELFDEKLSCSSQRHGKALLNQMDKLINKELDRNEFNHVTLLIKCIQHFCKSEYQDGFSLIQQGLVFKMVLWFERTLEFMKIFIETNPYISKLVEEFYDTAVVICKINNKDGVKQLLDSFLFNLGFIITENWPAFHVRLEAIKTFNLILDHVPREDKKSLQSSEEMCALMKTMARKLFVVGDYDVQVAISEALCRMTPKKLRETFAQEWFEDSFFAKAFVEMNDKDFETDCRNFLNCLNSKTTDAARVFTYPCVNAFADLVELQRPDDDKLKHFWIDFNVGSHCVSFYVQNQEGNLWDSVRLQKALVVNYSLQEAGGQKVLDIYRSMPLLISNKETNHIRICFESEHNIENAITKTFGDDLKKVNSNQGESTEKLLHLVGPSVTSPTQLQQKGKLNSLQDEDTYSELHIKSKVMSPTSPTSLETPKQDTILVESQESLKDSMEIVVPAAEKIPIVCRDVRVVLSPVKKKLTDNVKDLMAKKTETKVHSPTKHPAEKNLYSFESSLSGTDIEVVLPKDKMNSPPSSSRRGKKPGTSRRPVTRSVSDTKKVVRYRDGISSESGAETEKSWIVEPKKSANKSVDYSRKKQKQKSRLKVLPLSDSSNEDRSEKKETTSFTSIKSPTQVKGMAKSLSFSDVKLPGVSALLTPGSSMLLSSVSGTNNTSDLDDKDIMDPLQDLSSPECTVPMKVSAKEDFQSGVSSRVFPKMVKDVDDEQPQKKRKRSKSAEQELSFKPRKLFQSSERESGTPEDMKSNPDTLDITGCSFISSFETFTKNLETKMMSAYKKIESEAQDMLTMSHMHVSSLIGQIQQCKIRKLQHFSEIVTQELTALEVDNQALCELEKETAEIWEAQAVKIKEFCVNQSQRLEARFGDTKSFLTKVNDQEIQVEESPQKPMKD